MCNINVMFVDTNDRNDRNGEKKVKKEIRRKMSVRCRNEEGEMKDKEEYIENMLP